MNRIIFSLVSYFVCSLFFTGVSNATVYTVSSSAPDNTANTLAWAINQANFDLAGPHTINITTPYATYWGSSITLLSSNVTITGNVAGCGTPTSVVDWKGEGITLAGNNCVVTGILFRRTSLIMTGNNNKVFGCWFNMNAAGTGADDGGGAISQGGGSAVFVNGGTGNIVGLGSQCRNVFSGVSMVNAIRVDGTATNTVIASNYIGVATNGTTTIGSGLAGQNGIFVSGGTLTTGRIDSNIIAYSGNGILVAAAVAGLNIRNNSIYNLSLNGIKVEGFVTMNNLSILNNKIRLVTAGGDPTAEDDGFGIKLRNFTSNTTLIQGNLIGVQEDGHVNLVTDQGCQKNGIYARASIATFTINDNVVCDNGNLSGDREMYSGMFIKVDGENFGTITVSNNYIGVDKFGGKKGNDFAGINVRYVSGGLTSVSVTTNVVGDNGINGTSTKKSHGIAFEGFKPATAGNFTINGNYVGVYPNIIPNPATLANVGNYGNGIELNNCSNFQVGNSTLASANVVGFNKMATTFSDYDGGGIVIVSSPNANGFIQGNYVGVGPASTGSVAIGNTNADPFIVPIANHVNAGIAILNSSNVTVGGQSANLGNFVKNNTYGVVIDGAAATGNKLYRNDIATNTNFGVYIGGSSNTIGDVASFANANLISQNGRDGVHVYGTSAINNLITRNQISCNTGQGIKLNYGANQGNTGIQPPVITSATGTTVSGTATAGATVEIFNDDPACNIACGAATSDNRREGKTYLTTVIATGGTWTYTNAAVDINNVSATQTVGTNTSEFSICSICPPVAAAGSNQTLCNVTTATLAGNNVSPTGTGTWTVVSGTGTATSPNSPTSGVTGLTVGASTTFRWTVTASGCTTTTSDVTITISAPVTSNPGATQNLCNTTTATLAGNNPAPGTGAWTVVSGTGVVTTPTSATSGVTGLTIGGTSVFKWTITNGACSSNADVTINSSAGVTSNAGATQDVCNSTTATLAGNNPAPGTGAWTVVSGTGVVTTPTSPTSGVTGLTIGASTTFRWTVTNGGCSANSTVTINSNASVTSNAGATQNLCNTTTATLAGNNPAPGTGAWTVVSGTGVVTTPTSPTSGVTGLTIGAASVFRWTVTNGACTANTTVTINSSSSVTVSAGADQNVCNSTTATLAGSNPAPGTGAWTVVSGTGVVTTPTSATSGVTGLTIGAASVFRWTVTNGGCSGNATVTINSNANVTATAGATQNLCNTTTATLAGSNPAPGTGAWTVVSGTGVVTTPTSATSGVTGLTIGGTSVFKWTVTNGACSANADVTINSAASVTSNAGATQNVCNSTTATLAGNNPAPGTGAWTVVSGTGVVTTPTSATSGVTGLTIGAASVFRWTVTNGGCSANSTVTINSNANVTATAGATQNLCGATTATLAGSNPAPGTGAWTVVSGTGVVTTPTSATSGVTGLTVGGSSTFRWTVTNGACSANATVIINSSAGVTATANATANVCTTNPTVTLTGNTPSPGTGQWSVTGGTVNFGDANSPSTTATVLTGTSLTFTWTINNGSCNSTANAVTTVSSPVTATANSTSSVCAPAPVTLTGSNPAPGTGVWTVTSGGTATIATPTSPNTTANITSGTSVTFTWTITNGACTTSASSVSTTSSPVTASANATSAVCASNPVVSLTGNAPAPGTGQWSVVSGGTATFGDATSQSTTATVLTGTSLTFRWTVTNGACSATADATSTVSASVTANAGPPQAICNTTTATLAGSNPAPGTGAWTTTSGTGIVTTPSDRNSGVTALTIGGSSTFLWTVTNGACSATASVTISVSAPGTTSAGNDQELCNETTTTLAGSGTGTWATISGTGVVTTPNSPTSGVTGLTVGAVSIFEWTVTSGACSGSAQVKVTVDAPPVGDAGADQPLCDATTTTLNATGSGTWATTAGTGIVTTPTSATSGVTNLTVGGSSTFTWTVTNGACSVTTDVVVTSSSPVTANAGSDQALCNATTASLAATGSGSWTTTMGTGVATTPSSPTSGVTGLTPGASTVFQWTVTSGACSANAIVTIASSSPVTATAGADQPLCNATTATLAATGTGTWSTVSGTGVATTPSSPTSGVTGLTVGATTVFKWTVVNGACSDNADVSISSSNEATANAGADQPLCNATTANLAGSGTGTWSVTAGSGTVTTPNSATSGVTGLTVGTTSTFTWTVANGACTATDDVNIISSAGVIANAGSDIPVCNDTEATLAASGTGTWTKVSGPGSITTPTSPTSGVTGLVVSATSVFQWKVVNGACADSATVSIIVSPGVSSNAGATQYLCNNNRPFLTALSPLTGTWTVSSGTGTIENPSDPGTFATFTGSSAVFLWTASGVTCGSMTDTVTVYNTILATPDITGGSTTCVGADSIYSITSPQVGVTYDWSRGGNVAITSPNLGVTSVHVTATGNGSLTVAAQLNNCRVTASKLIETLPDLPSSRDTLKLATCSTSFVIEVDSLGSFFTGTWSSLHGSTITIQGDTLITLSNFVDGTTDTLTYSIHSDCGDRIYIYTLRIGGQFDSLDMHGPSDTLCVGKGRELSIDLYPETQRTNTNLTYVWVSNLTYTAPPANPVIGIDAHRDSTKVNTYSVNPGTPQNVYVGYVIDRVTQCKTDTASVRVYASNGQDLNIPNLITPNEDNQNDYWVLKDKVTGQAILPGSQFDLYNRWGQRVFGMSDYDNRFKADHISDGIYYFNVKSGCGEKEYKGWLQILGNTNP